MVTWDHYHTCVALADEFLECEAVRCCKTVEFEIAITRIESEMRNFVEGEFRWRCQSTWFRSEEDWDRTPFLIHNNWELRNFEILLASYRARVEREVLASSSSSESD